MAYWDDFGAFEAQLSGEMPRGLVWTLPDPDKSPRAPSAYEHQLETLRRLEQGSKMRPPISGIVHLPTGAGKTRIALEFIARTLAAEPTHRFLWATNSKLLIQQTMKKAVEYASLFPKGTRISWWDGDVDRLESKTHLTFLTTSHLRDEIGWAHDARTDHPWRAHVAAGEPLTLIYDESHQLGGDRLQEELGKFYGKVIQRRPANTWRVIGLSATPIPTRAVAQEFLRDTLFPIQPSVSSKGGEWGMHVFHRVENAALIKTGVLCEVNMHLDRSGVFDIPSDLMKRVAGDARVKPPGPNASKADLMKYAMKFDRDVMGNDQIVRFLADKLARNLDALGKTVVFVPNIDVANRLVAALNTHSNCAGKVAAVHSKMSELRHAVPGQQARTPEEVLEQFKHRGAEPCILVNVEMLTEGFDDPKVRTIVLAKLTLSTNRFWQMIGRGTRGPKAGGTTDCFLIDPIKLTRLYDYFRGYQPSIGSRSGSAIDDEAEESGMGALDPSVPSVSRPPLPSAVRYRISEELKRTHIQVAHAIELFLGGAQLGEQEAIDISRVVRIASEDGAVVAGAAGAATTAETGPLLLHETVARMRERMHVDLAWVYRQLPTETSDDVLRFWIRKLTVIEKLVLRTEEDYSRAEMEGRLAAQLALPVPMGKGETPGLATGASFVIERTAADVACVCAAVAQADGALVPAELEVSLRVVERLTGAIDSAGLRAHVAALVPTPAQSAESVARMVSAFDVAQRKTLVRGLLDVAAADAFVHPEELRLLGAVTEGLGVSRDYLQALIDVREG